MTEHRSATKGFYDALQQPENSEAKEFLESLLDDKTRTYAEICQACKSSTLFENLKIPTPQDLTRYRQRRTREENKQTVLRLIEEDADSLLNAAVKNPSGVSAKAIRQMLTRSVLARFDAELESVPIVSLSRETRGHALVEQRDRKLALDEEKLQLENKRLELQRQKQELEKDKFGVAEKTWQFILGYFREAEPAVVDRLTEHSDELLTGLEGYIEANG